MQKKEDISDYATGGGLMLGLGVGFFYLPQSPLFLVGCIVAGLGLGLMMTALIAKDEKLKS